MRVLSGILNRFRHARSGAAAVEFAIIGPLLVLLIVGIMSYGGYFWIAHSVQQAANDAARAAIGGLSDIERRTLAQAMVDQQIAATPAMERTRARMNFTRNAQVMTVRVRYDASQSVFWVFDALVPMPSDQVERSATIRLGGL
ncbi:MAG: TadE/TadG family type IV pilus assembly protein [Hyphomonadaceae bacterium]